MTDHDPGTGPGTSTGMPYPNPEQSANQYALFLHLSAFASFIVPLGGLLAPIIMWQIKKDEMPRVDAHGKNAVNFALTCLIYQVALFALLLIPVVGWCAFPFLALGLLAYGVACPIIAAVQANGGTIWQYPATIPFFR